MPWRSQPDTEEIVFDVKGAPAPLYRDPRYDGAADPSIIYNVETEEWWILYTQRRANQRVPAKSWAHGTAIGIASSDDAGRTWRYRGTLNLDIESGHNTFWAPDILHHDGTYHLYITYIQGVPDAFHGDREIAHYTSETLWDWTFESFLPLSSRSIDPDVHQLDDGTWRLWYKDSGNIYAADSRDLYEWTDAAGPVLDDRNQEAPLCFAWEGYLWLLTDPHDGLGVYRSVAGDEWERQENILREGGQRPDDGSIARHPDVLVLDDRAYIFYFVNPPATGESAELTLENGDLQRRSSLQVAELHFDGATITAKRNRHR